MSPMFIIYNPKSCCLRGSHWALNEAVIPRIQTDRQLKTAVLELHSKQTTISLKREGDNVHLKSPQFLYEIRCALSHHVTWPNCYMDHGVGSLRSFKIISEFKIIICVSGLSVSLRYLKDLVSSQSPAVRQRPPFFNFPPRVFSLTWVCFKIICMKFVFLFFFFLEILTQQTISPCQQFLVLWGVKVQLSFSFGHLHHFTGHFHNSKSTFQISMFFNMFWQSYNCFIV